MFVDFIKRLVCKKAYEEESEYKEDIQNGTKITPCEIADMPVQLGVRVLAFADTHGSLTENELQNRKKPNVILLLGDIPISDLEYILEQTKNLNDVPIFAVLGNHDGKEILNDFPRITQLSGKSTEFAVNGRTITLAGLSGSVKYKDNDYYCLLTQEESQNLLKDVPKCDILITHDKPCFDKPEEFNAHCGLVGIADYIREKSPKVVLHGHLHDPYIKQYGSTVIRCCYRVEEFEV